MLKLLIGGSPCTYWSAAKTDGGREYTNSGIGWELFRNYVIAKDKFKPDLWLYENVKTMPADIKSYITAELGNYLPQMIDAALVSGQGRKRYYWHNFGDIPQPEDRGILLQDVLEGGVSVWDKSRSLLASAAFKQSPANILRGFTYQGGKYSYTGVFTPVRVGEIGEGQANRVYSVKGKSVSLKSNVGGGGAKTGLYYINLPDGDYTIRTLTPTECERLMTVPDSFTEGVSKTQRLKMLGNGWVAEVIIHLLSHALRGIPTDEPILVLSMYDGMATGRYCLSKMGYTNVVYHAYEIDKWAIQIATKNYPGIIHHGDAFGVREDDWGVPG